MISIVVPCYNEEKAIPILRSKLLPVVKKLRKKYKVEVVFVDDGSTDKTYELLKKEFGKYQYVRVFRHKSNRNLGAALKTAFAHVKGDLVFTFDADCTIDPSIIFEMLREIDAKTDIVIASPLKPGGKFINVPFYRQFFSRAVSFFYRVLLDWNIHSYTVMVRLYRREALHKLKFKSNDFLAMSEILSLAILQNMKVKEVPAILTSRSVGSSKIRIFSEIKNHLHFILKLFLYKLNFLDSL